MRSCGVCKKAFDDSSFVGRRGKIGKLCSLCRGAAEARRKRHREKHPHADAEKQARYRKTAKGEKARARLQAKQNSEEGKKHSRELHSVWKNSPVHQAYMKGSKRKALKKKQYETMRADPGKKLLQNATVAICEALKSARTTISCRLTDLVDFADSVEMRLHFENQFQPWMNWSNHGNRPGCWSVGHRIPQSHFDASDLEDLCRCWNRKNLFPQPHSENLTQSKKLPSDSELLSLVDCWPKSLGGVLPSPETRKLLNRFRVRE